MCRLFFAISSLAWGLWEKRVLDKNAAVIPKRVHFHLHFTSECEIQNSDSLESSGNCLFLP